MTTRAFLQEVKSIFDQAAEKAGIKPLPQELYEASFRIDNSRNVARPVEGYTSPYDFGLEHRAALIGQYIKGHGVLAFCNEEGKTFVTKLSDDAEDELRMAGYGHDPSHYSHENFYPTDLHTMYANMMKFETKDGQNILPELFGPDAREPYKAVPGEEDIIVEKQENETLEEFHF